MSPETRETVKNEIPLAGLFKSFGLPRLIAVFFWFAGIDLIILRGKDIDAVSMWQEFIGCVPSYVIVIRTILAFAILTLARFLLRKSKSPDLFDSAALFTGSAFFACSLLYKNADFYLLAGVFIVCIVFIIYAAGRSDTAVLENLPFKAAAALAAVLAVLFAAFLCIVCYCRHMTYNTACFDMGIFAQMFHSMKQNFTAVTTCERDYLLSHLDIHASFIIYLLLPFYAVFPSITTLITAQVILAVSGVIPVVLIARKRGFKGLFIFFASIVYIFNSGLFTACFFHFHENCFLPPILMWLLYAVDSRKTLLIYILSVMTCLVKEDAPLYIICIGLFLFADEKGKKRFHGGIIAALALIYFAFIMNCLAATGSAEMMMGQRFSNLTFGENTGFAGIVMNILKNPSYFFSLFFSERSLTFFMQMMLPLLFLPFATTKIHRYFLMLPFVIMNLVIGSGYHYAAELGFHYTFGTSCLLIFMAVINCSELKEVSRRTLIAAAAAASIITAAPILSNNLIYLEEYRENYSYYQQIEACLTSIPEDAVVISDTNYLPHVAARNAVYLLSEDDLVTADGKVLMIKDKDKYDYYVLDGNNGNTQGIISILESSGYTRFAESQGAVIIYKKNPTVFRG